MKATVERFLVRDINSQLSEIVNARQEISRGKASYGVDWKFYEVSKDEFIKLLTDENMVYCVETKSGKLIEVDKADLGKFTNL